MTFYEIPQNIYRLMGRDSSVGIATRYGLDGPVIESRWGARFSAPVQTGPGAHPASCTMGTGSFPGVKRPRRGADHPPPSKCRGEERVGLYLYSPLGLHGRLREHLYLYIGLRILGRAERNSPSVFQRHPPTNTKERDEGPELIKIPDRNPNPVGRGLRSRAVNH